MGESKDKPKKILIVGGGTAGWMAAHLLKKCWADISVELIESADIGIIGVGEGSTPQLKAFFEYIGIKESEWMPACDASYKNGILFEDWSTVSGAKSYFHPFFANVDSVTMPVFFDSTLHRRMGYAVNANPGDFFLNGQLANQNLSPISQVSSPVSPSYGYHFDSKKLGQFLSAKAEQFGIQHTVGTIMGSELNDSGEISCVLLSDGRKLCADFFIDSTGFASLLLQGNLKVPFVSFSNNLFNDCAVVVQTERRELIEPYTISSALSAGWMWDIPLFSRRGRGYVYSSSFLSSEKAETELRAKLGLLEKDVSVRHLKMRVGRVENHWYKNCLAVGLSQGFIEPLEATALHLVQETVQLFANLFEAGGWGYRHQDLFNKQINHRFEGVRDYIVCHYLMNTRRDTDYWQQNALNKNISDALAATLNNWFSGKGLGGILKEYGVSEYYQEASWQCLLAGYGRFPEVKKFDVNPIVLQNQEIVRKNFEQISEMFELNMSVLNAIHG